MSPESLDSPAKTKRRRSAAPPAPATRSPLDLSGAAPGRDPLGRPAEILPAILDPFAREAAPAVMTRIALDWIIDEPVLNRIFDEAAEGQYTREWALGHFVAVMTDVACGFRPSPRAAFIRRQFDEIASISGFYRKLNRMEPDIPAAVIRHTARRARELIVAAGALLPEPIEGYACRILDGNALAGTEHRIVPLRDLGAAGLPGKILTLYEPASGLILEAVPEEDGHAQERALLDRIEVSPGQLLIMDRNFCVRTFLLRIQRAGAFFLVRRHAMNLPYRELGPLEVKGRSATGLILEQVIEVEDTEFPGVVHRLRRIVVQLDRPTREGDTEVVLVTNLPGEVSAIDGCAAYLERWQVERHYQALTDLLHCEVPGLGYPRAALFAFCMSAVAGNALAVLKGSLRAAHGAELAGEVSSFALVNEAAEVYPGMMLAVPPEHWEWVRRSAAEVVAGVLIELAAGMPVHRMLRARRGPKKPRTEPKRSGAVDRHVSTKKLLDQAKGVGPPVGKTPDAITSYAEATFACSKG
jgi:IS4 transposase